MIWLVQFFLPLALGAIGPLAGLAERQTGGPGLEIELAPAESGADLVLPAVTRARSENAPLVVIDPGHGGRDPGAASPFVAQRESQLTLALARKIRDALAETGRVRVALTRDEDRYLLLQERYAIARRLGADLFISLHADAAPENDGARGATVYTLSEVASDREAALIASRQNSADRIAGARMSADPQVNMILVDLAQRESMDIASDFAKLLHREAAPIFPFRPDWHRFAAFIVLKAPDIPSVLLESGYLTNETDALYIASEEGRAQIATGMQRAIEAHFARRLLADRR